MNKNYILFIGALLLLPVVAFSQYKLSELPTEKIPKVEADEFDFDFRAKWAGIGMLNSGLTKFLQREIKEKALVIYAEVIEEKKKESPNKKMILLESKRYKLHQEMDKQLTIIINRKVKMERLCFNYHKDTKTAQDILFRQVQNDSKPFRLYFAQAKSLEKQRK